MPYTMLNCSFILVSFVIYMRQWLEHISDIITFSTDQFQHTTNDKSPLVALTALTVSDTVASILLTHHASYISAFSWLIISDIKNKYWKWCLLDEQTDPFNRIGTMSQEYDTYFIGCRTNVRNGSQDTLHPGGDFDL